MTTVPPRVQRTRSRRPRGRRRPGGPAFLRLVGAVGVHLHGCVVATVQCPGEPGEVRRASPPPRRCRTCTCRSARRGRCAGSRRYPSRELSMRTRTSADSTRRTGDDPGQVLALVVGRDEHDDTAQGRVAGVGHRFRFLGRRVGRYTRWWSGFVGGGTRRGGRSRRRRGRLILRTGTTKHFGL